MKARVIIQIFEDGQRNVCFTQELEAPLSDFLVHRDVPSKAVQGEVLIISTENELDEALLQTEFRSVDNVDSIVPKLGLL